MVLFAVLSAIVAATAPIAGPVTAGAPAPAASAESQEAPTPPLCLGGAAAPTVPTCCFTNERYTGVCRVTLSAEETCDAILRYLNTPNTVGKTYCESSPIRGGWKQVPCPAAPTRGRPAR